MNSLVFESALDAIISFIFQLHYSCVPCCYKIYDFISQEHLHGVEKLENSEHQHEWTAKN